MLTKGDEDSYNETVSALKLLLPYYKPLPERDNMIHVGIFEDTLSEGGVYYLLITPDLKRFDLMLTRWSRTTKLKSLIKMSYPLFMLLKDQNVSKFELHDTWCNWNQSKTITVIENQYIKKTAANGRLMRTNYAMGSDDEPLPNDPTEPVNPFRPKPLGPFPSKMAEIPKGLDLEKAKEHNVEKIAKVVWTAEVKKAYKDSLSNIEE